MASALESVLVGFLKGLVYLPMTFLPRVKAIQVKFHELNTHFTRILTLIPFAHH